MPQSAGLRTFLRGKYAAAKLYQSRELYTPKDALDIAANPGDLVGIIQKKDPMGNTKRWFVDNGITQVTFTKKDAFMNCTIRKKSIDFKISGKLSIFIILIKIYYYL